MRKLPEPKASLAPSQPPPTEAAEPDAHLRSPSPLVSAPALSTAPSDLMAPARRPPRPAEVRPLAPARYKLEITMSQEAHDKLRRAQGLLRHSLPDGDPAAIVDRALTLLLENLERTKLAAASRPWTARASRTESRRIPAAVRRAVWARDGGRCALVGAVGRCAEKGFLELHHSPMRGAGSRPSKTSNCGVEPTINMKPSRSSFKRGRG